MGCLGGCPGAAFAGAGPFLDLGFLGGCPRLAPCSPFSGGSLTQVWGEMGTLEQAGCLGGPHSFPGIQTPWLPQRIGVKRPRATEAGVPQGQDWPCPHPSPPSPLLPE